MEVAVRKRHVDTVEGRPARSAAGKFADLIGADLRLSLLPQAMGITKYIRRARLALESASGATDFGDFTYFSFFLVVSALLLAVLFFRLGVEQRLRQMGVMRAAGFTTGVRRLLMAEGFFLRRGAPSACRRHGLRAAYRYGLKTWWGGAVGTPLLKVHISGVSLSLGAVGGVVAAAICMVCRCAQSAIVARALLTAQALDRACRRAGRATRKVIGVIFASGGMRCSPADSSRARRRPGSSSAPAPRFWSRRCFFLGMAARARRAPDIRARGMGALAAGFPERGISARRSVLSAA